MEQYEIPGFIDFHLHIGWTDFDHADQDKRSEKNVKDRILFCLRELSNMGFRMVRDAGGLETIGLESIMRLESLSWFTLGVEIVWIGALRQELIR